MCGRVPSVRTRTSSDDCTTSHAAKGKTSTPAAAAADPQCRMELGAADASAPPSAEVGLCLPPAADVADADQIPANGVDPKGSQRMDAAGHQTFTARLVDRALSGLEHDDR